MEVSKISSLFILLGLSFLSGTLSILTLKCLIDKLGTTNKLKKAISMMNCFSGGVFFATSILDLLPEAREAMDEALAHYDSDIHYPLTELLFCIGFFLILTLEHFAHFCFAPTGKGHGHDLHSNIHPGLDPRSNTNGGFVEGSVTSSNGKRTKGFNTPGESEILVRSEFEDSSYIDDVTYKTFGTVDGSLDKSMSNALPYHNIGLSRPSTPGETQIVFDNSDRILIRTPPTHQETEHTPSTKEALSNAIDHEVQDQTISKLRGVVLLVALSLHMVFDGLALGLLDKDSKVWQLLAALSLHKILVFFTIGLQSLEILASAKKAIVVVGVLALVSPCGILLGT